MSGTEPDEAAEKAAAGPDDDDPGVWPVPDGVLNETLFQLTMNVVMLMDTLAAGHLSQEGYKYVPHRETRKVTAYKDSGWPNVGLKSKDETTIAFGALFAATSNSIHPFQYDAMPPMNALEEYVRGSVKLLERLRDPIEEHLGDESVSEFMLRHRVHSLPASIFDRAKALGLAIEDPAVGQLYLERERSWLAPQLEHQYVVPLVVTDLDIDHEEGLVIDSRTRIVRLNEDELCRMAQPYETAGVPSPLADAAWWALVIDMPPLDNPGEGRRPYNADPVDTSTIDAAVDALRVVSAVKTGWARVFRRPLGWAQSWEDALPNLVHIHTARRYPAEFDHRAWLKKNRIVSAEAAAQIPAAAAALQTARCTDHGR